VVIPRFQFEDAAGLPSQVTVQATKRKLLESKGAALDALIRVTENQAVINPQGKILMDTPTRAVFFGERPRARQLVGVGLVIVAVTAIAAVSS